MQNPTRPKSYVVLSGSESQFQEHDMSEIFLGLGANGERQVLRLGRANRHGLIAGATGTGKTVTLQTIAEQFSAAGVPVFMADVKGDLPQPMATFPRPRSVRSSGSCLLLKARVPTSSLANPRSRSTISSGSMKAERA